MHYEQQNAIRLLFFYCDKDGKEMQCANANIIYRVYINYFLWDKVGKTVASTVCICRSKSA